MHVVDTSPGGLLAIDPRTPAPSVLLGGALALTFDNLLVRVANDGSVVWETNAALIKSDCTSSYFRILAEASDGTFLIGGNVITSCKGLAKSVHDLPLVDVEFARESKPGCRSQHIPRQTQLLLLPVRQVLFRIILRQMHRLV